jgi:hypothetical protein
MGVKRILNVAIECADDKQLRMSERFERYHKIPMRDIVEESGVAKGMEDACKFLGAPGQLGAVSELTHRRRSSAFRTHIRPLQGGQVPLRHRRPRLPHPRQRMDIENVLRLRC